MPETKCQQMQVRARKAIPGMTQLLSKRPDMFTEGVWPAYYSKAVGAEVWDLDGTRYIDVSISGIGANVLGYADPDVDAAVIEAIKAGSSSSLNCPEEVELAELLCELHPWADMARFARTGGEALAVAVRIARAHTGRDIVAFCGYHGWHDWYLSANLGTENALGEHLISGLQPAGVPRGLQGTALPFRFNQPAELQAIAAAHGKSLAAIVMEPLRNEEPEEEFIACVNAVARETGAVLVIDEVSAGFRMNTGGAHLFYPYEPDMAVFSKALGNGYPIAAIIGRAQTMEAAQSTFISSTMWTERIGPTAALATVKKHRQNDVGRFLTDFGRRVQAGWQAAGSAVGLPVQIGGMPAMSHFVFGDPANLALKALFIQKMLASGYLASNLLYAMYAHRDIVLEDYLATVTGVFAELKQALDAGEVEGLLKGKPASGGFKRLN